MEFPLAKLYTNNTGRLPIRACSGNQYITIAFHSHCNTILCTPYVNRSDTDWPPTTLSCPAKPTVGTMLTSKSSTTKSAPNSKPPFVDKGKVWYQLVPSDVHRLNAAKHAIQTFKSHFLTIIASLPPAFPHYLWDLLLPQTKVTLKLLCQSSITPSMSVWEHFNGPFDYNVVAIGYSWLESCF
jgi:hypothetical protein